MHMKLSIKSVLTLWLALCGLCLITACSDDDGTVPEVREGVVFSFARKLVYTTGVNEIGSVKITLQKDGEKLVRPSLALRGDADLISSRACPLAAGHYRLTAYTAYSTRHEFLFDAELDSKNEFDVLTGEVAEFKIPVKTKEILNFNFLRNALMGLCRQVFGDDESAWPWNPKKYPYPDWEGLEFELDDYGSPMYLSGISFEGMKDGKPTPWARMTAIPDGTLSNIAELATINVTDIPAFKQLPSDLDRLPALQQISCIRTGLEQLPDNVASLTTLSGLFLIDCQVSNFDYDLSALSELRVLSLSGNRIARLSTPLGGLSRLVSLDVSRNPLQAVDDACFANGTRLNQLYLAHTELDALPASLAAVTTLRSLDISGCRFTAVPEVVNRLEQLKSLSLDDNRLSGMTAAELGHMSQLESLSLAGNPIGQLPVLDNSRLVWLDLRHCGLSQAPDLKAYPDLRVLFLGDNAFSTLPENYFAANPVMTVLNLSASPRLTALPAQLGLHGLDREGKESFRLLEVENCPALHWTTPADWRAYDFNHSNDWIFSTAEGTLTAPGSEADDCYGRVGIRRAQSPHVGIAR